MAGQVGTSQESQESLQAGGWGAQKAGLLMPLGTLAYSSGLKL